MERGKRKGERGREGGIRIADFGLGTAEGGEIRLRIADFGLRIGEGGRVPGRCRDSCYLAQPMRDSSRPARGASLRG